MDVNELRIPSGLLDLIAKGIWPSDREAALAQNLKPIIGPSAARKVSADDDAIHLCQPPFSTIEQECSHNAKFWIDSLTNVGQIDYSKSLIIADFGIGSDSAIILNYETGPEPRVMYLKWLGDGASVSHTWVCSHDSFDGFAKDIGLGVPNRA